MPKMFTATFFFLNIVCVSCLKVSPPLSEERPIDFAKTELTSSSSELQEMMQEMMAPLTPDNFKYLETTGLRPELEQILKKTSKNMSFIFIGDSVVRNQWQSFCHLIHAIPHSETGSHSPYQHCQKNGITAITSFIQKPEPDRLSELLAREGVNVPDVIYWDSAQLWGGMRGAKRFFKNPYYSEAVGKTLQNMRTLAPKAKNCFFMTHAPCEHQSKVGYVSREQIAELNEIAVNTQKAQGGNISVVDGYALTKDQCSMSPDGRHFNKLVWHELKMLLEKVV